MDSQLRNVHKKKDVAFSHNKRLMLVFTQVQIYLVVFDLILFAW
jgi:hypothetical protein